MATMSRHRIPIGLLGVVLLAAGIYEAAQRGVADAHYYRARSVFAGAAKAKRLPTSGELTVAEMSINDALANERSNPLFVEQRARVHEQRALLLPREDPRRRELLRLALAQYREAALLRPGSPYAWAAIAALKLRLDELDYEFYGALERAERFGRWEPQVQLALADIGFAGWRLLAQPGKERVLAAIGRALPRQIEELRRVANASGSLPAFCAEEITRRSPAAALCVRK